MKAGFMTVFAAVVAGVLQAYAAGTATPNPPATVKAGACYYKPNTYTSSPIRETPTMEYLIEQEVDGSGNTTYVNMGYGEYFVWYARVDIPVGSKFTVWCTTTNVSFTVMAYDPLWQEHYRTWLDYSKDWNGNDRWTLSEWDEWDLVDYGGRSIPFLITVNADSNIDAYKFELKFAYEVVLDDTAPKGSMENPDPLDAPAAEIKTVNRTFPPDQWGWKADEYYMTVNLEADHYYTFRTKGSQAEYLSSVSIYGGEEILKEPAVSDIAAAGYDHVIGVYAFQSGSYDLVVSSSSSAFELSYFGNPGRLPSKHESQLLTPGASANFRPGHIVASGSKYKDNIIDECLFAFDAVAGGCYRLTTTGAATNLLMQVYNSAGGVLAEARARSAYDFNPYLVCRIEEAGRYYVGVCQDLADDAADTPTYGLVGIQLESCGTEAFDAWDPADDDFGGCTRLAPTLTNNTAAPSQIAGAEASGPHRLSPRDSADCFSFPVRSDFTYKVQPVLSSALPYADWSLRCEVLSESGSDLMDTEQGGVWTIRPVKEDVCRLRFRVFRRTVGGEYEAVDGADCPDYSVYACAYSPNARDYGYVTVVPKGPSAQASPKWRFAGMEPEDAWREDGAWVLARGIVSVEFSDVAGFSTPAAREGVAVLPNGQRTEITAVYSDTYDPGDNTRAGAVAVAVANAPVLLSRTMWGNASPADEYDWFKFSTAAGVYYNFEFTEISPGSDNPPENAVAPGMFLYAQNGTLLDSATGRISWGARSAGTLYLCVKRSSDAACCGLEPFVDCAYTMKAWSVDTGSVVVESQFVTNHYGDAVAEIVVRRTSSQGAVSVNWGTVSGSAEPGVDYVPCGGVLAWEAGDPLEKTVQVKLVPPVDGGAREEREFSVRLWPAEVQDDDQYPAVISDPPLARVTLNSVSGPGDAGALSLVGHGLYDTAFADAEHPSVAVAPGQRVRLWVDRQNGANGRVSAKATASPSVAVMDDSALTWQNGEAGAKCMGLLVPADAADGTVISVRIDNPPGGNQCMFGARRVRLVVDASLPTPDPESGADAEQAKSLAMQAYVGKYTVALVPGDALDYGARNGYLSMAITADGTCEMSGFLTDGTQFSGTVQVVYGGDALLPAAAELQVPLSAGGLSGTIRIAMRAGEPVVVTPWEDAEKLTYGSLLVTPVGGIYHTEESLQALWTGCRLVFKTSVASQAAEVVGDGFSIGGVSIAVNKANGTFVASGGTVGRGILVTRCDEYGEAFGAVGFGQTESAGLALECTRTGIPEETWKDDIEVHVSYDGAGNTSGTVPAAFASGAGAFEIAEAPSADFAKNGFSFEGWMLPDGSVVSPGDSFEVAADDMVLAAVWRDPDIESALGCSGSGLVLVQDPEVPWVVDTTMSSGTVSSMRSGEIPGSTGGQSVLRAVVRAERPTTLSFKWACSISDGDPLYLNGCRFLVDGVEVATIGQSRFSGWLPVEVSVSAGRHTFEWVRYKMRNAYDDYEDCAWVDDVKFGQRIPVRFETQAGTQCSVTNMTMVAGCEFGELPAATSPTLDFVGWALDGTTVTSETRVPDMDCILVAQWEKRKWLVSFDANGASNASSATPAAMSGVEGSQVQIPGDNGLVRLGYDFIGWHDGIGDKTYSNELYTVLATNVTMKAQWSLKDLTEVIKGPGLDNLAFEYKGADWTPVNVGGVFMLRSGAAVVSSPSTVKASVLANGAVSFTWKTSCCPVQQGGCRFVRIRGGSEETLAEIGGIMTDWQSLSFDVQTGDTLEWRYWKSAGAPVQGEDCAWLERVSFGKKTTVSFVAEGGDPAETVISKIIGTPITAEDSPVPEWQDKSLSHWIDPDGTVVTNNVWLVPDHPVALTAVTTAKVFRVVYELAGGEGTPAETCGTNREVVVLSDGTGFSRTGYEFSCWTIGGVSYSAGQQFRMPASNVTATAEWTVGGLDGFLKGPGLDSFSIEFVGEDWKPVTIGGVNMMQSGEIGNGQRSVLRATALSAGTVEFVWKSSCDDPGWGTDALFKTNGVTVFTIGGVMSDWETREIEVAAGTVLEWSYSKDSGAYAAPGEDCVWLERLSMVRKSTLTFYAQGGNPETTVLVKDVGVAIDELPSPIWATKSLDYWKDENDVRVEIGEWIVPDRDMTLTAVTKDKVYEIAFDVNGGTPSSLARKSGKPGDVIALYGEGDVAKAGLTLAGWTDGSTVYAGTYTIPLANPPDVTTLTAVWGPDYASALGCKGSGVAFSSTTSPEWIVAENDTAGAKSQMMVQNGAFSSNGRSAIEAVVPSDGSLSFGWRVSCDDISTTWVKYSVNDVERARIGGTGDTAWHEVRLEGLKAGDRITWAYEKKNSWDDDGGRNEDRACLQNVVWTPDKLPEYEFTVNWGEGVLGATYSIEDGDQNVEAVNGEAIAVPDGKKITVAGLADTNNWYYITGGTNTFDDAGSTTITAAKRSADNPGTAAEIGLDGAFADADEAEVVKVLTWAEANDKTVADVNAMTFGASGDPVGVDAEAYLLNCAPADVATEAAKFKVTSFSVDASGNISITPADGDAYGNGSVEVRYSSTPGGEYTTTKPSGAACFIKIYLVK
ncbi:MAG: InlB B-repeat-containing protein [Kiritimatiellae bacterium]|nr:InlB B-repeat-containing protein [Kiritimatiellia bacterium]